MYYLQNYIQAFQLLRSRDLRVVPNPDCIVELTEVAIITTIPPLIIPQNMKPEYLGTGPGIDSFISDSNTASVSNL